MHHTLPLAASPMFRSALLSLALAAGPGGAALAQGAPPREPLVPGGAFTSNGHSAQMISTCEATWAVPFPGQGNVSWKVRALAVYDDGSGPGLYVGGEFFYVGGVLRQRIARWDGAIWSSLASGLGNSVLALAVYDDGNGGGPALYAGGVFTNAINFPVSRIARWDGTSWSTLGSGMDKRVTALVVHDDGSGSALYAGGWFTVAGQAPANRIARWDGTSWSALGSGMDARVNALCVYDDGSGTGPALFAGGAFQTAGGVPAPNIARWDGTGWSGVGSGMDKPVNAFVVHDDGSGPALYAGGDFLSAGGVPALLIARWNGTNWSALGTGPSFSANALAVHDDGTGGGPTLYTGHQQWDGNAWSNLVPITGGPVHALLSHDDGSGRGPALFAGGRFNTSPTSPANGEFLARWGACDSYETYCTAGVSAKGCQALLSASGIASASLTTGFELTATGVEGQKDGLFFYGTNGRQANTWGSGTSFVCVVPPRTRGGLLLGSGSAAGCNGSFTQDLNARWCATCPKPSHNPGAGAVMQAQLWYRDPLNTSNQTSSMSDAIEFLIVP